jgi:hypothetical protein
MVLHSSLAALEVEEDHRCPLFLHKGGPAMRSAGLGIAASVLGLVMLASSAFAGETAATMEKMKGEAKGTTEEVKGQAKGAVEDAKGNKMSAEAERAKGKAKGSTERAKGEANAMKEKMK